jgi:hypothetical protein
MSYYCDDYHLGYRQERLKVLGAKVLLGLLTLVAVLFVYAIREYDSAWRTCMDAGFPDMKGDYCIKRENGTDWVVHVDRIRAGERVGSTPLEVE